MKRLLLFILLFGSGLAILFKLQGGVSPTADWVGTSPEPAVDTEKLIPIPTDADWESPQADIALDPTAKTGPEANKQSVRVEISKKIRAEFFPPEGGRAIGELNVQDSKTNAQGSIDLYGITISYFDRAELAAKTGQASLVSLDGSIVPKISWDQVSLIDVEMELKAGHPLAPMTLKGPQLNGDLPGQVFNLSGTQPGVVKPSRPRVEAPRFDFEAAAIHLHGLDQILRITGDARGTVRDRTGAELYRLSGETIEVRGLGDMDLKAKTVPVPFRLHITGSATLTVVDTEAATLSSNELILLGTRLPSGELILSDVKVDGTGVLAFGTSTFTGSSFTFDFDKAGGTGSFVVGGAPHVVFDLAQALETPAKETSPPLVLDCVGPLTVARGKLTTLVTRTPTTLTCGETTLTSKGGFVGSLADPQDSVSLQGSGGVILESTTPSGELLFRTESLLFDYGQPPGLPREILITSQGAASFQAEGAGANRGVHIVGTTAGSLVLKMSGDLWTIPEAHSIDFTHEDSSGQLRAAADHIASFDPVAKSLDARGDVHFTFKGEAGVGGGSGELVVISGLDLVTLEGVEGAPATFSLNGAEIAAGIIARKGELLSAHKHVSAELPVNDGVFAFECESLRVTGLPSEGSLGATVTAHTQEERQDLFNRGLGFSATGGVSGEATLGDESITMLCASLTATQAISEVGLREVEFVADTVESATWKTPAKVWSVTCGTITATSSEQAVDKGAVQAPVADRSHFSLVAEAGVAVRERVTGFLGNGEFLKIERGQSDKIHLDGGLKGATVAGPFPSNSGEDNAHYKGQVTWIEVTDGGIVATNIDLEVRGMSFMGADKSKPLRLRCNRLEGVPGTLQLDGDVSITGSIKDGPAPSLSANHATFTDKPLRSGEMAASNVALDVSFLAHGQVLLRQGRIFEMYGTDLIIEHGGRRIRAAGLPATVSHSGFVASSAWVEFDTELLAFECGKGEVFMDPKLSKLLESMEERGVAKEVQP
jgi:hypothetical protein